MPAIRAQRDAFTNDLRTLQTATPTLVRESEVPQRGQEVGIAVDPESVLVMFTVVYCGTR